MSADEQVTIRAVAAGGDGVATLADGRTVFVPRSAPGDQLILTRIRRQSRFARAEIGTLLQPAPGRVTPPCRHYLADRCGSCQLQHLDGPTQRQVRQRIVGDALRRIGHLDLADPTMVAPGEEFGYRTTITLTVRGGAIGYHRLGAPDQIIDVSECLIAREPLQRLLGAVRAARSLLPRDTEQIVMRQDVADQVHLVLRTSGRGGWTGAAALAARLGPDVHIWWHPAGGAARQMAGGDDPWPATVFAQVNPPVADRVRLRAIELLGPVADRTVWDLYAGSGAATAILEQRGARVISVERDPRAVAQAERRGPAGPLRRVGDVADWLPRLDRPGAVLTNPPRTGMEQPVTQALLDCGAERVVYISCDPATLARDLARLAPRYRVVDVTAWDQFPQTAHVETITLLEAR